MSKQNNPMQMQRKAQFQPTTFNDEERSVEVVFSSEEPAMMWNWDIGQFKEILSHDPDHIRLGRMENGVSALDNHNAYGSVRDVILGSASEPRIEDGRGLCKIRFSSRPDLDSLVADVKSKVVKDISVGYRVHEYQDLTMPGDEIRTLKAIDWEPYEVSFVAVPADANAQVRSQKSKFGFEYENLSREDELKTRAEEAASTEEEVTASQAEDCECEEGDEDCKCDDKEPEEVSEEPAQEDSSEERVAEEQARCLEITETCQCHGLKMDFAKKLITDKIDISKARKLMIDQISQEKNSMHQNTNVTVVADERDKKRSLIESAISHRLNLVKNIENEARAFRHLTIIEMFKELDPSLRSLPKHLIAKRAFMTSSDLPLLLEAISGKSVAKGYELAPRTFLPFVNKVNLPDYKEVKKVNTSLAAELKKVAEGGEYEFGKIGEGAESYHLSKYGRVIRFTEEMFINDDLGELEKLPKRFAMNAAALESKLVYGILTGNPMMADQKNLFDAAHGNLGTNGAISETTLSEMYEKFLAQKDGENLLNINPEFLIVGPANRTDAMKMLASLTAVGKSGDVNIFQNDMNLIVDANIAGKNWFAAANPAMVETIDVAYLDGMEAPEVTSIADQANDSILIKCKHVFAAKAVDHKGLFKNPRA